MAASLRSTGWTGTIGSSPSEYSEARNPCAIFQAQIVGDLIVRFPAERLAGRRSHERQLRVEPCRLHTEGRTAGVDAQTGVQGRGGELPSLICLTYYDDDFKADRRTAAVWIAARRRIAVMSPR
jgi:hypothetical protein